MKREGPFWDAMEGRAPPPPCARTLGWKLLELDPERGLARVEFEAKPEFANPIGNVQGGFLTAMLDDTMGPAVVCTLGPGRFAPTLELKVSFIRPAEIGKLVAEARVVHKGRSICYVEGSLRNPAGELVATATATTRIISLGTSPTAASWQK